MIRSLLLKLGVLVMTIGVVFWARWAPQPPVPDSTSATEKQVVISRVAKLAEQESKNGGSSSRNAQGLNIDVVAQTGRSHAPIHARLDLNRASVGELESLPGIGSVLAHRVIAFRESVGRFQRVEDLREVKGIGAKKFERLKSFVVVSAVNS
ncbi:MAG: helix-hairpin-helix domain-containing protein [Nitrospira sp.]|nr:helix-hairpin-helix domain-containing protein [Nitrospira sp.]